MTQPEPRLDPYAQQPMAQPFEIKTTVEPETASFPTYDSYLAGQGVQDRPLPAVLPPAPTITSTHPITRTEHPMATPSLVLGILGVLPLLHLAAPFALGLAVVTQIQTRRQPDRYRTSGKATAGLVLGIVGTVFLIAGMLGVLFFFALLAR